MATEKLRVILELITDRYTRGAREAASATDRITKSGTSASASMTGMIKGMVGIGVAAVSIRKVATEFKDSIRAASDLGESVNAVNKTFGEASGTVLEFGRIASVSVGLSTAAFNQLSTSTGSALRNLGLSARDAANETIRLAVRAADMASVFNTDVDQALNAINSSLAGQQRPLKQFAVNLDDASIRAKAVEMGLAETTGAVDKYGKALATVELIYEQTNMAAGDFLQTSGDLANAARISAAEWENAKASFGESFAPIAASGLNLLTDALIGWKAALKNSPNQEYNKTVLAMGEANKFLNQEMAMGEDRTTALANALVHVAINGKLSGASFEQLAASVGMARSDFGWFTEEVIRQATAMGFSQEVIDELIAAMGEGMTDGAQAGADGLEVLVTASSRLADNLNDALVNLKKLASASLDPLMSAVKAEDAVVAAQKKLDDLKKGTPTETTVTTPATETTTIGGVTYQSTAATTTTVKGRRKATDKEIADATLDLAKAKLELDVAKQALGGGAGQRGLDTLLESAQMSNKEVRELAVTLGILNGTEAKAYVRVFRLDGGIVGSFDRIETSGNRTQGGGSSTANITFNNTFTVSDTFDHEAARQMSKQLERVGRELVRVAN